MVFRKDLITLETDLLVIGGGLAGCMAAIKGREHEVKALILEKSHTIASGQAGSGIDHVWGYIPPVHEKMGWTIEDLVEDHMQGVAHGFGRRDLIRFVSREIYPRLLDLETFGIKIRYQDSSLPGGFRLVYQFHSVPTSLNIDGYFLKKSLTREAKRRGVEILNRVMVTDLLSENGKVTGALAVGARDGKVYRIAAKSVILAAGGKTGRLGRESTGCVRFNLHLPGSLSADGKSLAFRAGLAIMNMEFLGARRYGLANYETAGRPPRNSWQPAAAIVDAQGKIVVPKTTFYEWGDLEKGYQIDAAATRRQWLAQGAITPLGMPSRIDLLEKGPYYVDCTGASEEEIRYVEWALQNEGKCRQLLKYLQEEGIDIRKDRIELGLGSRELGNLAAAGLIVDGNMETTMQGLFAAGDEVGGIPFGASSAAFTTGWHAGDMAGQFARTRKSPLHTGEEALSRLQDLCTEIMSDRRGYSWREVEDSLQNIMDAYCADVKTETMLARGLSRLLELKDAPLQASNPHDLTRCLEVKSLLDNAEMIFRTSLARKESRGKPFGFYRSDFPQQDDANWYALSTIQRVNDEWRISRIPLGPQEAVSANA
ncbi:MAG: FAD-dependent oxidoreductase [Syntrophales bacterium]|jgi:succinate dehydrogenase/fumarate reductase flavoprotein subunit|nr:FAD-dependent oxidoreductase [Syntrophales bacterium]